MRHLELKRSQGVLQITLDHPPLNILDIALLEELARAFGGVDAGDRVVVLRGAGKHFSAGADVAEHLPEQGGRMLDALQAAFEALFALPVPALAVVRGACMGAGFELAAACDLMLVADDAKLGVPEITLGVIPPLACVDLPARIGPARAAELAFTGRTLTGAEAARIGLALEALESEALDERARALIERLAAQSPAALRACKQALRATSYREALALYRDRVLHSADGIEGLSAFLEKRKPVWIDG